MFVALHFTLGFNYLPPPPLPPNHIDRKNVLDEIATKLLHATNDSNKYETTLTITGAAGFGKTTTVISLCHYPVVKEQFTDGFVFIELGPKATDSGIKLRAIYNLLTNEQCDINVVEQKINQLTSKYYRNLLVIIDDVWDVEDAEPLVKAFSNCKTILTTRMNNIEQYISSKQSVIVGPMTNNEAISLLTSGVIDSSQLSQEDVSLLDELAQDVHLWPLLLSLIRGQLSHNLRQYHLSYHNAIQSVKTKLQENGLIAFDKNDIENAKKSRKFAVKACIELTLDLLKGSLSDRIKSLILWTGIGTSLQTAVLNNLWNISEQEAEDTLNKLWAYGLVQITDITISPNNITQHCVEVHAVISQYIIDYMDSEKLLSSSDMFNSKYVIKGLKLVFQKLYGVHDPSTLAPENYLRYKQSEIESNLLPYSLKSINMLTVKDPHFVILLLQRIKDSLITSPNIISLMPFLGEKINSLIADCKQSLKDSHKLCRKLNQSVQRNLCEKKYDVLIQSVEEFLKNYPFFNIAKSSVTLVKKIIPYCNRKLLDYMKFWCEELEMFTYDYHLIPALTLPYIKLYIKQLKQITSSLLNGLCDIELLHHHILSGKFFEDYELLENNYLIKIQDVAPEYVRHSASLQYTN